MVEEKKIKEYKKKEKTKKKGEIKTSVLKKLDQTGKEKKLKKEIDKLKKELIEINDKYLRIAAEFTNYKKRSEREFFNLIENANKYLFLELLPIIDDFERSLNSDSQKKSYKSLKEGAELIYQKLVSVLKKQGLEPLESIDTPFDPEFHEALMQKENKEKDSNIVLEEVLKGYRLKDKVIRHSKVIVNK